MKINSNYLYPRIIQIIPCENIWIRYLDEEVPEYFYVRACCLALMENQKNGKINRYLQYIEDVQIDAEYSERDLTMVTTPCTDTYIK